MMGMFLLLVSIREKIASVDGHVIHLVIVSNRHGNATIQAIVARVMLSKCARLVVVIALINSVSIKLAMEVHVLKHGKTVNRKNVRAVDQRQQV
jgi:hypothetical protein